MLLAKLWALELAVNRVCHLCQEPRADRTVMHRETGEAHTCLCGHRALTTPTRVFIELKTRKIYALTLFT